MTTYQETIEWLFQQFPSYQNLGANAYKPSLENIIKLCKAFDNPQDDLTFIHVAGSNGKGSTCSMLASILTEANYTTGLFTSPHITDFRERMRVNGKMPSESYIVATVNTIRNARLDFEPSFFEISFLLSLLYFKEERCDICVIETGLGGRLDATNVITPIVSLITNISLEHQNFLGDTIAKIAFEKAGIIKQGIPFVTTEIQEEAVQVFVQKCLETQSTFEFIVPTEELPEYFPLHGFYQQTNFALVQACLASISKHFPTNEENIRTGLMNLHQNTGYFGRLQIVELNPMVIADVSHNPAGIEETLKYVRELTTGQLHIIYGTSSDKDLNSIFPLFENEAYYFTEFSNPRSCKIETLKGKSEEFELNAHFFKSGPEALTYAQSIANKEDTILITGSFFLLSDFF